MSRKRTPALEKDMVIIPRQYLHAAGGTITLRDTPQGVTVESQQGKKLLQTRSRWKRFSDQDPFLALIGTFEDAATDVSSNKYAYLADAYSR